jgi:hypothetical protein
VVQSRDAQNPDFGKARGQASAEVEPWSNPEVVVKAAFAWCKSGDFPQAVSQKRIVERIKNENKDRVIAFPFV